jgi:hypothetical protein
VHRHGWLVEHDHQRHRRWQVSAPNAVVLDLVRQALDTARQAGDPVPGRPTLMKLTGATDHQVRKALAILAVGNNSELMLALVPDAPDGEVDEPLATGSDSPASGGDGDTTRLVRLAVSDSVAGDLAADIGESGEKSITDARQVSPAVISPTGRLPRPWPLVFIGLAAAVAIWGGWVRLGELTGFGPINLLPGVGSGFTLNTALVLPLSVEFYSAYALRVLLASSDLLATTHRFARRSFIASLVVGGGAQIASHVLGATHVTSAPWPVTTLVACVPLLVVGLATGLATLVKRDATAERRRVMIESMTKVQDDTGELAPSPVRHSLLQIRVAHGELHRSNQPGGGGRTDRR